MPNHALADSEPMVRHFDAWGPGGPGDESSRRGYHVVVDQDGDRPPELWIDVAGVTGDAALQLADDVAMAAEVVRRITAQSARIVRRDVAAVEADVEIREALT